MSTVLITGGTGFIGSRLALRCLAEEEAVRVLAQRNTQAEVDNCLELEASGVAVHVGSVTDPSTLGPALEGVDVVYHLAAAQHEANVPDSHFHQVNVDGTRNVLEGARRAGVRRVVHGSTIGVYGSPARGPVDDRTPLEPENIYGVTKLAGERVVAEYAGRLDVVVARISETYGPGDRRLLKLFRAVEKGRLVKIGPGRNLHHLVYIDDLVRGLRLAAASPRAIGETFVLVGPRAVTSDEMISAVAHSVGRAPPRLRLPLWPLMAAAVGMETILQPLGIQPPLHRRRMNFFIKSFRFDPDATEAAVGFRPEVDVEEGMRATADWYRAKGLIGGNGTS